MKSLRSRRMLYVPSVPDGREPRRPVEAGPTWSPPRGPTGRARAGCDPAQRDHRQPPDLRAGQARPSDRGVHYPPHPLPAPTGRGWKTLTQGGTFLLRSTPGHFYSGLTGGTQDTPPPPHNPGNSVDLHFGGPPPGDGTRSPLIAYPPPAPPTPFPPAPTAPSFGPAGPPRGRHMGRHRARSPGRGRCDLLPAPPHHTSPPSPHPPPTTLTLLSVGASHTHVTPCMVYRPRYEPNMGRPQYADRGRCGRFIPASPSAPRLLPFHPAP